MRSGRYEPLPPPKGPPVLAWHAAGAPGERLITDTVRLRELLDAGVPVEVTDAGRNALEET